MGLTEIDGTADAMSAMPSNDSGSLALLVSPTGELMGQSPKVDNQISHLSSEGKTGTLLYGGT